MQACHGTTHNSSFMMSKGHSKAVYSDYLQLDKVLSAQELWSAEAGAPVHEELLFIIVHQVYELWFKQILSDLNSIFAIFKASGKDQDMETILIRLQRIKKIFHLLLQEFEVLETMTSLEFLNFRGILETMSGFQSHQFRLMEMKLGLRREDRIHHTQGSYGAELTCPYKEFSPEVHQQDSLFLCIEKWLGRFPFLERENFCFRDIYAAAFEKMVKDETDLITNNPNLKVEERTILLKRLEELRPNFDLIFHEEKYQELIKTGKRRLSYHAFMAALFIRLYRHRAFLHLPDLLLTEVIEVNALFSSWRFRHIQMVKKMIGWKTGTGGTSGIHYLQETIEKYDVFEDFSEIPMLLIPEPYLPSLPDNLIPSVNLFF